VNGKDTIVTSNLRRNILRANALYIGSVAFVAFFADIRAVLYGVGPLGRVLAAVPDSAIGFIEAHGLAFILAVLLWRGSSAPSKSWHVTALGMEVLLGTCNLVFWQLFIAGDALVMGYVTTILHWVFVVLQAAALIAPAAQGRDTRSLARRDFQHGRT
jgi:hypothetical protein